MKEYSTSITLVFFLYYISTVNDQYKWTDKSRLDFHLLNYSNKYCFYDWIIE